MQSVELRHFVPEDAVVLRSYAYADVPLETVLRDIEDWTRGMVQGRSFEMLAVIAEGTMVGMISLWERSAHIVSIGPEVFEPYRKQGYGRAAMEAVLDRAATRGYTVAVQQVRIDNEASIALHESLGFESDGNILKNRRGNPVHVYVKVL